MEYAYQKLMKEHNLTLKELPEDAQIGIATINNIGKAIAMQEKKGRKVTSGTLSKLKAQDKWVVAEIMDYVEGSNTNDDTPPIGDNDVNTVIATDPIDNNDDNSNANVNAEAIELELTNMFQSKKTQYTFAEVKSVSPVCYDIIFKNYDDSGDNGVETDRYLLVETEEEIFTLTKK